MVPGCSGSTELAMVYPEAWKVHAKLTRSPLKEYNIGEERINHKRLSTFRTISRTSRNGS